MIRFPCPECKYEAAAADDSGGQKMFCPNCYCELTIPYIDAAKVEEVESKVDAEEVYDLHRSGVFKAYDGIPVYCKLCRTLMYASEEQIGSELTCPDCGVKTAVLKR